MRDRKKIAAIMAAVDAYGSDEGERQKAKGERGTGALIPKGPGVVSLWRVSGRQEIMQMRALWQRRIVPR
ncbi:hypothetical protein M1O54_06980 [Dehalococcoidia bacterium]|nr:hypothetical protein [Dehalococcoidia bacterium]MCL0090071.1 hypothetical protein [Dehalococcoidia bacterium]